MDSERAETCLRTFAESELRRARAAGPGAMADGVDRVHAVASAFAAAGALDSDAATALATDLGEAFAARSARRTAPPGRQASAAVVVAEGLTAEVRASPPLTWRTSA